MGKFILGLIFIAVLASAFNSSFGDKPPATASPTPATPAEIRVLTGPERDKIVAREAEELELERDKIEKVSFYSPKSRKLRTQIEAYIALPDNKLPFLRMKVTYFGDDWVFYKSIKIMADDQVVYASDFARSDVVRNNSSGKVWEVADILANDAELIALNSIAKSKSATIRFAGDERRHDHEVTKNERREIQRVLDVYAQLSDKLKLKSVVDAGKVAAR